MMSRGLRKVWAGLSERRLKCRDAAPAGTWPSRPAIHCSRNARLEFLLDSSHSLDCSCAGRTAFDAEGGGLQRGGEDGAQTPLFAPSSTRL